MKYLLDTHTLIWALKDSPQLTSEIREEIINEKNVIYVSVASLWEIQLKHQKCPDFHYSAKQIVNFCQRAGYIFLAIGIDPITGLEDLKIKEKEYVNKDPFDKILLSQAKVNNMVLLTHDQVFSHYEENCIRLF